MNRFFLNVAFFCLCATAAFCSPDATSLLEHINKATAGDFVVIAQGKTRLLLHINSFDDQCLYLEEITVSASHSPAGGAWKEWIDNGAPHLLSWVMYEIDRRSGSIVRCYSFSRRGWLDVSHADAFLTTLFTLDYHIVPEEYRRRIGPRSPEGAFDNRPLWSPRIAVDGVAVKDALFDVCAARWPKDGTELSNKEIELYLPRDVEHLPSFFPSYITIRDGIGKATARIVDSGRGMTSPYTAFSPAT